MNLDVYAKWTKTTWASNPKKPSGPLDTALMGLGLVGESHEVLEAFSSGDEDRIVKELGDFIYYWARLIDSLGWTPSDVVQEHIVRTMDVDVLSRDLVYTAAQIAELVKKLARDGKCDEEILRCLLVDAYEIWRSLARDWGHDVGDLTDTNKEKLTDRLARGKLRGSGDNR